MLYSISVPETDLRAATTAVFQDNFHHSEARLSICGGLFFLKKRPKRLMMNQLNQLELVGSVQKILATIGGIIPVRVVYLFLPAYSAG